MYSKAYRKAGLRASTAPTGAPLKPVAAPAAGAVDLAHTRDGLGRYHQLVATTTDDLWHKGGGRWSYRPGSAQLAIEMVRAKDQYETPAHLWRHAIATYALDRDAHASTLNAVLPCYDVPGGEVAPGARYWINPAYGVRGRRRVRTAEHAATRKNDWR